MADFHCSLAPADRVEVGNPTSIMSDCVSIRVHVSGASKTVYLVPEDALRFAQAILNAADVAAEAEQA